MQIEEEAGNNLNDDAYFIEMEKIRDKLVDYAKGAGPFPVDANSFFEWMFWNFADNQANNLEFVFHLDQFDLSDSALRDDEELSPSSSITDSHRLHYIRQKLREYMNSPFFKIVGVHYLPLSEKCPTVHIGLLGHEGGISIDPEYIGLFPSKAAFLSKLYQKGYFDVGIDPEDIPDEALLSQWSRND